MGKSKIEWTDVTWNPVTGCTKVSAGCKNCYAERMAKRLGGRFGYPADDPFKVTLHHDKLKEPLRWKKPRRVFVCSMGDFFHDDVPDEFIWKVFRVMASAQPPYRTQQHTFMLLTKRVERMVRLVPKIMAKLPDRLNHVQYGVSAENQKTVDERALELVRFKEKYPGIKIFLSLEPTLGPVLVGPYLMRNIFHCSDPLPGIDGVILGGESGPGARPLHPDWARKVRDDCEAAKVPFFFKQWGEWLPEFDAGCRGLRPKRSPLIGPGKPVFHRFGNGTPVIRVGKKAAGALLDGKEHKELP